MAHLAGFYAITAVCRFLAMQAGGGTQMSLMFLVFEIAVVFDCELDVFCHIGTGRPSDFLVLNAANAFPKLPIYGWRSGSRIATLPPRVHRLNSPHTPRCCRQIACCWLPWLHQWATGVRSASDEWRLGRPQSIGQDFMKCLLHFSHCPLRCFLQTSLRPFSGRLHNPALFGLSAGF